MRAFRGRLREEGFALPGSPLAAPAGRPRWRRRGWPSMVRPLLITVCEPEEQMLRERPRHEFEADWETVARESGRDGDRGKPDHRTQTPVVAQSGQVDIASSQCIGRDP